jgi:lipopolysaccharide/colanic/teichoic acid biosynthesis glycosyltransferase
VKRVFDLVLASAALIVFSPVLLVVVLLVATKLGRPVLFKQVRPGLQGRPFQMFKFRTMLNIADENGNLLPDQMRLTRFGRLLRSTSLDELPGLLNVVRGDMSLVGPRPLLMQYLPLYSEEQARRHLVRPGLTGWAQVNGRNSLNWDSKFKLDTWYIDNRSFALDLRILWMTVRKVLMRDGIAAEGEVTMPPFTGNQHNPDD